MTPDLEVVQVRDDQSFKVWSHGYPFRTVRWHFHPEYELHLVTATEGSRHVGDHIGAFAPGDLVMVGPNLPHNWISDVAPGERVEERCLVLQFTDALATGCMALFPELRFLRALLAESRRGVLFDQATSRRVAPLMRALLEAPEARRIAPFLEILDVVGHARGRSPLAGIGFRQDASGYLASTMNLALQHIGRNFTRELGETELSALTRQSPSTFSRAFRRHTGTTFVHYVNALRVELACQHLGQDDLSVTEICHEVGFRNVSNFNRQFLVLKGMPPSRFRSLRRTGRCLAAVA